LERSGSTGQPGLFVQYDIAMAVYDALEASRRHPASGIRRGPGCAGSIRCC